MLDTKQFQGDPFAELLEQLMELPVVDSIRRIKPSSEEIELAAAMGKKSPQLRGRARHETDADWDHSKAMSIRAAISYQRDLLANVVILRNLIAFK